MLPFKLNPLGLKPIGFSVNDYVQNSLVAFWDAEWNVGNRKHSSTTTTWVDLVGNYDAVQQQNTGWYWSNDSYVGTQQNGHGFVVPIEFTNWMRNNLGNFTAEFVCKPQSNVRMVWMGQYNSSTQGTTLEYAPHRNDEFRCFFSGCPDCGTLCWNSASLIRKSCSVLSTTSDGTISTGKQFYVDGLHANASSNGVAIPDYNTPTKILPNNSFLIGGDISRSNMSIVGEICAIRFYSRVLAADEITSNYAIDKVRFSL